jgi:hypothetical protein
MQPLVSLSSAIYAIENASQSKVFRLQEKQDKLTINNVVPNQALQENTNKSHKPVLHVFILRG